MSNYFAEQCANPHAVDHALGWAAAKHVDEARARIAETVGADADEIIFTSGATESNNLAILGLAEHASPRRNRILVSAIEHKSVLAAGRALGLLGCELEILPVDAVGRVLLDVLEERLTESVLAVSVGLVNAEIGTRQDLRTIVSLAERIGAFVHTDAAQALADDTMDVHTLGVAAASLSAHKIYGPQGVGALFVSREWQSRLAPRVHGGGQQQGLRSGTVPVALCRAFADAVELTSGDTADRERSRIRLLRDRFAAGVQSLPGVTLNGPPLSERHDGNCNIRIEGQSGKDLLSRLQPRLAASTGSACSSGIVEPFHVLTAVGLTGEQADSSVRFSFGRFTTEIEIDQAIDLLASALVDSRASRKSA